MGRLEDTHEVLSFWFRDLCHDFLCEEIQDDRTGLTRSAASLFLFIVVHAVGNRHVFKGPDDLNGNGYFYARLCWTGVGPQASIDEEYVLLCALLLFSGSERETRNCPIWATIFAAKNFKISSDRTGRARNAALLIFPL